MKIAFPSFLIVLFSVSVLTNPAYPYSTFASIFDNGGLTVGSFHPAAQWGYTGGAAAGWSPWGQSNNAYDQFVNGLLSNVKGIVFGNGSPFPTVVV